MYKNVFTGNHYSYEKVKKDVLVDLGFPYDIKSVMQYGSDDFKKNISLPGHVILTLDGETVPLMVSSLLLHTLLPVIYAIHSSIRRVKIIIKIL